MTYRLEDRINPSGTTTTRFIWSVTEHGWQVREDDLAYFHELMKAIDEDDAIAQHSL